MDAITVRALADSDVQRIHETSLRVLQEVGIDVHHEKIHARLLDAGAIRGATNSRLLIPEGMVKDALAQCDRDIVLDSVRGEKYPMGTRGPVFFSSCVIDPFMLDYADGHRPPRLEDCATNARLVDALDAIAMPYKMDLDYSDASGELALLKSNFAFMSNMSKHYICAPHDVRGARIWMEMCEIMADGSLRDNRIVSAFVSPMAPLTFDPQLLEIIELLLSYGIMLVMLPCPQAGATSPFSIAGTVVDFNVENLATIVIAQTLSPGSALHYHNVAMSFNMKHGVSSLGGPEKVLCALAGVEMGRFYGLSSGCAGTGTDSVWNDIQNGAETMSQLLPAVTSGAKLINGIGSIGNGMGTCAEQILFDCDLIALAERLRNGICVDDAHLAFEAIKRVGPGGNFLMDDHTLRWLRSGEHFYEGSFERSGSTDTKRCVKENLHARILEILNEHTPAIPDHKLEALQAYVHEKCS